MPLYEYECVKCHHRFEKIEHVNASTTKKCPECGARAARLPSAPAIQFKGSGWYVTDYAGKNSAAASEEKSSEKSSEKASDSAAEKPSEKSEKKPAAKDGSRKQQKKES